MQIGSNLFPMRARDYTPATGQFLSNDPLGLAGGDTNIRRYVGNDPVTFVDPTGEVPTQPEVQDLDLVLLRLAPPDEAPYEVYNNRTRALDERRTAIYNYVRTSPYDIIFYWSPYWAKRPDGEPEPPSISNTNFRFDGPITSDSEDPNALVGPVGYGTQEFIQPSGNLPYTVEFENDGSLAAQVVTVSEQLSANLDWSTFQLGSFGFGSINVSVPAGLTQYQTTVAYQNTDGTSLNVQVSIDFDVSTGLLTGTFTSVDPITGQAPTGIYDGFLYPESTSVIDSEGFVQYTVQPAAGLTTGDTINQQAAVVFDVNAPLDTALVTNTIDSGAPTSSVATLPATETSTSFIVSWNGTDDASGSGIASYSIYVSDDGGPYTLFETNTTLTSATFTAVSGHTYSFYSVATDNVGNVQPTPLSAQATTNVTSVATKLVVSTLPSGLTAGQTTSVTVTAEDASNSVVTGFQDSVTLADSMSGATFSAITFTNGQATVTATLDKVGSQTITATDASATISGTSRRHFRYAGRRHAIAHHQPATVNGRGRQRVRADRHGRRRLQQCGHGLQRQRNRRAAGQSRR